MSLRRANSSRFACGVIGSSSATISSAVIGGASASSGWSLPSLRTSGGMPVDRCRSDAFAATINETADRLPARRARVVPTPIAGVAGASRGAGRRPAPARAAAGASFGAGRAGAAGGIWIGHDAHRDLRAVAQDRDLEGAVGRSVIEFDARFLGSRRRACSGMIGPISCRISWRVSGWLDASMRRSGGSMIRAGIADRRGAARGPSSRSSSSTCLQRRSDCVTSVSATMCAELTSNVRSASST